MLDLTALDGKLYAGGYFSTVDGVGAKNIACWNPATQTWLALGSGMNKDVYALTALNRTLCAGGAFNIAGGEVSAYWAR